nr:oligosaccharide flippase family protein [Nitritalea halalkaliphila]
MQHQALLSRQMQFQRISSITMQAAFFSLLPALAMAYLGAGYWALVAISALNSLITCALLWVKCSWRPDFHWPSARIKSFLGFGAGISGFNIINYFSRNLDNVLIGKYLGSGPLGLYSKAYQLLMLPITQLRDPLNSVGIPAMSSLRAEPGRYRHYYSQFLFFMAFFSMPITLFLLVNAEALILLSLGAQWVEAIGIFQLLAITAFIQPVASTRGMVMISSGLSTRYFYWGLANAIVVTLAFVIGIRFGLSGIAIAYAIANYLILIPSLYYCFAKTPVTVGQFLRSILAPASTALFAAGMNYMALRSLAVDSLWLQLGTGLLSFGLSYLGLWALLPPLRPRLKELLTIAKSIKKKP